MYIVHWALVVAQVLLAAILQVASAFSQMLNLHNLSENISNAQQERAARMGEVSLSHCLRLVMTVQLRRYRF